MMTITLDGKRKNGENEMRQRALCAFLMMVIALSAAVATAQEMKAITLPDPDLAGGKPLMRALSERHTSREYDTRELPTDALSNLLWAAFGINRPDSGRRTAPSAMNWQETDIYVVTAKGTYLYDPKAHALEPHISGDLRALTGQQGFVGTAPLNLVYVADLCENGQRS